MKILITAPGFEDVSRILEDIADVELTYHKMDRLYTEEELIEALDSYDAVIVWIDPLKQKGIVAHKNHLKVIGVPRAGYDNVDIESASKYKIPIVYASGANAEAVADFVIASIYNLSRNISKTNFLLKTNQWKERWAWSIGFGLRDRTLGIIGLGNIGCRVALQANSLGLKILGYDHHTTDDTITPLGMFPKEISIELTDLETLLAKSDYVSVHVPLTKDTRGMIGYNQLNRMKRTAFLINTSRGGIVDEVALYDAVKNKKIAGAAIDVFEKEPPDMNSPIFKLDNIVATPHIAWCTENSIKRVNTIIAKEVRRILEGKKPNLRYVANPFVFSK
jgi:phosphoglycerate dehydrogenase-like enzyme